MEMKTISVKLILVRKGEMYELPQKVLTVIGKSFPFLSTNHRNFFSYFYLIIFVFLYFFVQRIVPFLFPLLETGRTVQREPNGTSIAISSNTTLPMLLLIYRTWNAWIVASETMTALIGRIPFYLEIAGSRKRMK